MEVIDIHVHLVGKATRAQIEEFLEKAELAAVVLISRDAQGQGEKLRQHIEELSELRAAVGERVVPFARIDPTYPKAPETLDWAVKSCGIRGLKMLPANFHPADPCAHAMYEKAAELKIPMLMHTGILWLPSNNANNCRPANMEVMWDYPAVRFAMAHIGWPWTDECIAVAQKLRVLRKEQPQAFVDLTPGTPKSYRQDALAKCLENVRPDHMMYGSDTSLPTTKPITPRWTGDKEIFDRLGVPAADQQKIFGGTARRFLGLPPKAEK